MSDVPSTSFLARHEFLLRRLHSLSGVLPVGAYMCVHLGTNSLAAVSPAMFNRAVEQIHSLGVVLPIVEWTFIFLPIIFHALYGILIIKTGKSNSAQYRYGGSTRYMLQRVTGMIAMLFIAWHVFHMHGWFHFEPWHSTAKSLDGAQFAPFNAFSSAAIAMQLRGAIYPILYAIGVGSCIFHLANGLWTFGITWGLWVTPEAQKKALYGCGAFGGVLSIIGIMAWSGFALARNPVEAEPAELERTKARVAAHEITAEEAEAKSSHKPGSKHEPKKTADPDVESSGS